MSVLRHYGARYEQMNGERRWGYFTCCERHSLTERDTYAGTRAKSGEKLLIVTFLHYPGDEARCALCAARELSA